MAAIASLKFALLWAAFAAVAGSPAGQCFELEACAFRRNVRGTVFFWDLHQLCQESGGYTVNAPYNTTYSFNICGNTSTLCSPPGWTLYHSHGVAVQTWSEPPECLEPTCTDWDTVHGDTSDKVCCTGVCEVLGTQYFEFSMLDPDNPSTGGIQLTHAGMPSNVNDPFDCPYDPSYNLPKLRTLHVQLACDPSGSVDELTDITATEVGTCYFLITASTKAACGTPKHCSSPPAGDAATHTDVATGAAVGV